MQPNFAEHPQQPHVMWAAHAYSVQSNIIPEKPVNENLGKRQKKREMSGHPTHTHSHTSAAGRGFSFVLATVVSHVLIHSMVSNTNSQGPNASNESLNPFMAVICIID